MAKSGFGTKLRIGANAIAELTEIGGIEVSKDTIEVTTMDSPNGYREFIGALKDGGDVSMTGFFNPNDTLGQVAVYNALDTDTPIAFSIEFPSTIGASWSFYGVVTKVSTSASMEDGIPFEATVKVSGKPVLNMSLSTGITALALTGGTGTMSPTAAAGTMNYAYVFTTATSITVTATAAGSTIKLYVDGSYVQDLTSGVASNAIGNFAAQSSKQLTLVVQEANKVAKIYDIIATRTT